MALTLGEEKRAKPKPRTIRLQTIKVREVCISRNISGISPTTTIAIPVEARILGSILSESLPARGEKTAITIGWETRIKPAVWGFSPLTYCR